MGRPSKLTPETQKLFVDAIAAGNYVATAAELAGIGQSTYYRWLEQGKTATRGRYREFWDAVKKAEAQAEAVRVARIARAGGEGNWQADAWYLERRYPDRWGRRQRLEHTQDTAFEIVVSYANAQRDAAEAA